MAALFSSVAGTAMLAGMFIVSPAIAAANGVDNCNKEQQKLADMNQEYKDFLTTLGNSLDESNPDILIKYQQKLENDTYKNIIELDKISNNNKKTRETVQIISLSVIGFITLLFAIKYFVYSKKINT